MIGHALLAVLVATAQAGRPAPAGIIALTTNEIRRLFTVLIVEPTCALACPLAWSSWRCRHQPHAHITTSANRPLSHGRNDFQLEYDLSSSRKRTCDGHAPYSFCSSGGPIS
jgi:hypothetical protein